mmetsp:Transcript_19520/g.65545  ORF Transcript_19520/g.65545 Transcript_19520/m.65545 type:complete len:253 (-) Transcript_19520:159-917(-)
MGEGARDVAGLPVAEQVVELVHVHRVAPVGHHLVQEHLVPEPEPGAARVAARVIPSVVIVALVHGDELLDGVQVLAAALVAVVDAQAVLEAVHVVQVLQHAAGHALVRPLLGADLARLLEPRDHLVVEQVGEGPVAQVVAEPREGNELEVPPADPELGLAAHEVVHPLAREHVGAQRVLKPRVRRARVHVARHAELLEVPEALELGSVDDAHGVRVQSEESVHAVVDQLAVPRGRRRRWWLGDARGRLPPPQ